MKISSKHLWQTRMPGRTVSSRLKEWWPVGGSGQRGFSLVELVLVVSFLGILMMIAIPTFRSFVERARVSRAAADIRAIEKDITSYALDYDRYPNSLSDIHRDGLRDPWGHPYQYVNLSSGAPPRQSTFFIDLNSDYDLYSLGQDGQSAQVISDPASLDDVIRVSDGGWVGKGANF